MSFQLLSEHIFPASIMDMFFQLLRENVTCLSSYWVTIWTCISSYRVNMWACFSSYWVNMSFQLALYTCFPSYWVNMWTCLSSYSVNTWTCISSYWVSMWACFSSYHVMYVITEQAHSPQNKMTTAASPASTTHPLQVDLMLDLRHRFTNLLYIHQSRRADSISIITDWEYAKPYWWYKNTLAPSVFLLH